MYSQQLVLSGVMDVRDRYLRALAGLDEARVAADAGTRTVLTAYRVGVMGHLAEYQRTIAEFLEGIRSGDDTDDPRNWDTAALADLSNATIRGFDLLANIHYDLCTHLPGVNQTREDLTYLLMRSLEFSLLSGEHTRLVSVQQSQNLTWEATRFTELQSDGPSAAAIAVPWLETLTPLRWPLAVHELGHYFLPGGDARLLRPIRLEEAARNDWREGDLIAFEEVLADAVAYRAFGNAYPYALAREGYLLSHETHLDGGISIDGRLRLLGGPQELIENLPGVWGLKKRTRSGGENEHPETTPERAEKMRETAARLVGEGTPNRPHCVALARRLMRAGEPAAAVLVATPQDGPGLAVLRDVLHGEVTPTGDKDEVASMTGLAVHEALSDGEILEAAWLEDCERDVAAAIALLENPKLDQDAVDEESRTIAGRDTWLARALQSAAVHRWLSREEAESRG